MTKNPSASEAAAREAPYLGQYALEQGSTEPAGQVNLLLFAGGDYAIGYFGGMQQGTWRPVAGGELELREWPGDPTDFAVYGRHTATLGPDVRLAFRGFEESHAKIGLVEAGKRPAGVALHPAFNDDANCYASSYQLTWPAGKLKALQLAVFHEADREEYQPVRFSKKLLYSFPIGGHYNDYRVLHLAHASRPRAAHRGRLVGGELRLCPVGAGGEQRGSERTYRGRRPISAPDLAGLGPYLQEARQPLPAQLTAREARDDENDGNEALLTYERVPGTTQPLQVAAVQLLAPLFVARCE